MSRGLHRRPGAGLVVWLAAAAVLVMLVAATTIHLKMTRPQSSEPPPAEAPSAPGRPTTAPAAPPPTGMGLLEEASLTWVEVCGVLVATSTRHGPHHRRQGRAYGFDQSPAGAVLAALHLAVQVSPQRGPQVFIPALAEQVTGPDAASFTQQVHQQYEHARELAGVSYGQPLCPIYGRFVGYLIDGYADTAASLRLLIEAPGPAGGPQLAGVLVQLSWVDDDWRLIAPPLGDWSRVSTLLPVTAADQYTPLPKAGD